MQMRVGERLRLTMSGVGCRAMVSLNTFLVTQPAIEGLDPSEDGFTYDVTSWLQPGRNILTVVLIGPPEEQPFRLTLDQDGHVREAFDETALLRLGTPWRLWTHVIDLSAPTLGVIAPTMPVMPRRCSSGAA